MNTLNKLLDIVNTAKIVDMTHSLEEGIPHWPTQAGVTFEYGFKYKEDGSYWRNIHFCEHSGTHIDALSHFVEGAENVDEIPINKLMGRGVNIDVTHIPAGDVTSVNDVKEFEKKYGEIQEGDIVFFRFGWDDKWATDEKGKAFMENWPGTSQETAEYLLSKKVSAVGTDASALDAAGTPNPSHKVLLGNGINIIENVNNLAVLPPFFGVIGLPCKFKGGSGSTMRLIALLDK
jgi:arylformamidase